ncbi:MAG TPA: hypothetical protein VFD27_01265 [Chthoniobacteraceae bacterium]|nr:hypothetical protein [Chthoniobacteraceae bacterium]
MKPIKLRVRRYNHSDSLKWVVGWRENGKRKRTFFETEQSAAVWVEQKQIELGNHAIKALTMPDELRMMAISGAERLRPYGKTVGDAVEHFIKHLEAVKRSCTVAELIEKFVATKQRARRSPAHLATMRSRLGRFSAQFGERVSATVTTAEIDDWLGNLDLAGETRNNLRRETVGLFNFAVKRHFAEFNPAIATERVKDAGGAIRILTPDELRVLLEVSAPDVRPFFAIGAFAGLRVAEIKRLDWSRVNLASGFIEVTAGDAKTRQRRLVKIEPNLAAWLATPRAEARASVRDESSQEHGSRAPRGEREGAGIGDGSGTAMEAIGWRSIRTPTSLRCSWATRRK